MFLEFLRPADVPEGGLDEVHVLVDELRIREVTRWALVEDIVDADRDGAAPEATVGDLRIEDDLVADSGDTEVVLIVTDVGREQGSGPFLALPRQRRGAARVREAVVAVIVDEHAGRRGEFDVLGIGSRDFGAEFTPLGAGKDPADVEIETFVFATAQVLE